MAWLLDVMQLGVHLTELSSHRNHPNGIGRYVGEHVGPLDPLHHLGGASVHVHHLQHLGGAYAACRPGRSWRPFKQAVRMEHGVDRAG